MTSLDANFWNCNLRAEVEILQWFLVSRISNPLNKSAE